MTQELYWETEEFDYTHKSNDWYWAVGITTLAIIVASIIFENVLFALFILIASVALVMQSAQKPSLLRITLQQRGVRINSTFYPFNSLEAFWVEHQETGEVLLIKSKKTLMPYLVLPLGDMSGDAVENFLGQYLTQEELHEPLAQKIMERLGF